MKAAVIYQAGGPEQLKVEEVETPHVKQGWSLVKVKGFGINHSEIFTRNGLSPSVHFPRILGIECVGIMQESTCQISNGQRVISIMGGMGRAFDGGYAEYVLLPNEQIYPVDTDMSWPKLAMIPETYYTAFGSMLNLNIKENNSILVRGATSGVGVAFCQLAQTKYKKVRMTGTTRSLSKKESLLKEGFDDVILDNDGKLVTEQSFDRVFDLIGPASLKDTCAHTNESGIVCTTGLLGGQWYMDGFDPIADLPKNGYLTSFHSENVDLDRLNELMSLTATMDIYPQRVYALDQIQEAHSYLESHHSFGKLVVVNEELQ